MNLRTHIEIVAVEDLIPYAGNARTHSPEQIDQIAASIRAFEFVNPILIRDDNTLIAGHGRLLAAQKLGMESVSCIRLDHLSEAEARQLTLADNKIALGSGWDEEMLRAEIDSLRDLDSNLDVTGFSGEELDKLLDDVLGPEEPPEEKPKNRIEFDGNVIPLTAQEAQEFSSLIAEYGDERDTLEGFMSWVMTGD